MRWLFTLAALTLAGVGVSSCGDATHSTAAPGSRVNHGSAATISSTPNGSRLEGDEDDDDSPSGYTGSTKYDNDADFDNDRIKDREYYDSDDNLITAFGQAASPSESNELTALVRRYEADAAAGDGATACSLMAPLLARTIPEDYGRPPGPPELRGTNCQAVMVKLFRQRHKQLIGKFRVVGVRVDGNLAYVLMGSSTSPASYMTLKREAGSWKINSMLSGPLP
jgi:hypothetical protein